MSEAKIWASLDPFFESGPILGRKVANAKFLSALLRADGFDQYHFFLAGQAQRDFFISRVREALPGFPVDDKVRFFPRQELADRLGDTDYHCFHQSDCITYPPFLAAVRNKYAKEIFPITGVTHSLSYARYPGLFLAHLWPGTTLRDVIVSTSRAGRRVVENIFTGLEQGYGLNPGKFPRPGMETIPLGVDPEEFASKAGQKNDIRRELGLSPDKAVILVFGRIEHDSKMDLVPIFRALQRMIADGVDKDLFCLVLSGWRTRQDGEFAGMLQSMAQSLGFEFKIILNPDEDRKQDLYRASDIFLTMADNPQETFGLTVLEGMAAGLAVVATDYDGYKDLVVHGETGFLIPTTGPGETPDIDIQAQVLFDNQYHLLMAQRAAFSVPGLANALRDLILDPDLGRQMGLAGQKRVMENFTWDKIAARYMDLWDRLWQVPVPARPCANHPMAMEFGRVFGRYTTENFTGREQVRITRAGSAVYRDADQPVVYAGVSHIATDQALKKLLFFARKPIAADALAQKIGSLPDYGQDPMALVLWAVKQDLLELC